MSSTYANDVDVDWKQGSRWSTQAAIRAQDRKFRLAVIAAHPEYAPPAPPVIKRLAAPRALPRDVLTVGAYFNPYRGPSWRQIVFEVAAKHRFTFPEILSGRRDRRLVEARYEAFWRLKMETSLSLPAIGHKMGRDHTTVLYGIRQHEAMIGKRAKE